MGSSSSKVSKKIPPISKIKKPLLEFDAQETPNPTLLNSVMSKYPVSVEKPISISSQIHEPKPRKVNLAEYTKSLNSESYYSAPKLVQDEQGSRGLWN